MTTIPISKPVSKIKLSPGSIVRIPNVSWQEFESILQELGENRSARIAYSDQIIEIIVPLPEHEIPKEVISDLVKIILRKKGIRYESFGSTTFKKEGVAGIEPDACFYIQNYQSMIGVRRLQSDSLPPDLAIEIDVTSKTVISAYASIRVKELWIFESSKLTIYLLQEGKYIESSNSHNFPKLAITEIVQTIIERTWKAGSFQALQEFETTLSNLEF